MTTDRVQPARDALPDTGVPRLPDPPPSLSPQLVPPTGLTPPSGAVPSASQPTAESAQPAWSAESMQAVHRATNEQIRSGRRSRGLQRSRRERSQQAAIVVLGVASVVAIVIGVAVVLGAALPSPEVPTYPSERPSYGLVELQYTDVDADGTTTNWTQTSDESRTNILVVAGTDVGGFELRRTSSGTYVLTDGVWSSIDEDRELRDDLDMLGRLPIFSDVVPDEARSFTRVLEEKAVLRGGRDVTRLKLVIDDERFEKAAPERFEEWLHFIGELEEADEAYLSGVGFRVWVDADGVVWRFESASEITSLRSTGDVVRIENGEFIVEPPTYVAP